MAGVNQGFTLLLEVVDRPEGYGCDKDLLEEAVLLLKTRWNIDGEVSQDQQGKWWGWLCCSRFLVSGFTVGNALGDMHALGHVKFYRGPGNQSKQEAIRYQSLKRKWNIQDPDESASSNGGDGSATPWYKRPRH